MATIVQKSPTVLYYSGSVGNSGSIGACALSQGYSTLVLGMFTAGSTIAACGLRVDQSFDGGVNWDYTNASNALASGASSACSVAIIGNAVRVQLQIGATGASRVAFISYLRAV